MTHNRDEGPISLLYKSLLEIGKEKSKNTVEKRRKNMRRWFTQKGREMASLGLCVCPYLVLARLLAHVRIMGVIPKSGLGPLTF